MNNNLTFTLLGDFHYDEGSWPTTVSDLEEILASAQQEHADFILHTGDFCMDYKGAPEVLSRYLGGPLPAYGVMGNHELEKKGNTLDFVAPRLTNADVHWGTADEKVDDGYIAYYWFEAKGIRFVCTDTNYTFNPDTNEWERNTAFIPRIGNLYRSCLGEAQLQWLENVLCDAARKKIPCVTVSHAHFHPTWDLDYDPTLRAGDSDRVQRIFAKANAIQKGTVIMAINGHVHTNRLEMVDNILYFDVNSPLVGWWEFEQTRHYTDEHTFLLEHFDEDGNRIGCEEVPLYQLNESKQSNYYDKPLFTTVTICDNKITVAPKKSSWRYGISPEQNGGGPLTQGTPGLQQFRPMYSRRKEIAVPEISGGEFIIEK